MNERKYTREICEAIWRVGGRIKSTRSNKHLVIHTTLSPKPMVFSTTPNERYRGSKTIEKTIRKHIKYNPV